jgi:glycosyltransferase involved in cell wall biosynthesis
MKILHVITKSNWGGAQRHVFDLALAMKEKGESIIVALGGNGMLRERLEDVGIKTYSIAKLGRNISFSNDMGSFGLIFSIIRREKPDVIHLHSPKAAGLGALAARILRVKNIVFTVHGFAWNEDRPLWQKGFIAFASWLTMVMAHKIIVLSDFEYKQAINFPFIKNKITIIPLGIKVPVFMSVDGARQVLAKQIGMELGDMRKKVVIGTIAELHKNKGLKYLLKSLVSVTESHKEAICIVIGDGELLSTLHMEIKKLGLEGRVFLTGYMAEAFQYLKAFNIFVLSSVKEGLPYVIFEAGFASLPVVATTVGGIPEMIEDMKSGVLVQSKDAEELSHAISYIIEHPLLARQYGATLRERLATKYSIVDMVEKVEKVYR